MLKKILISLAIAFTLLIPTGVLPATAALIEINFGSDTDLNVRIGSYKSVGSQLNQNDKLSAFGDDRFYSVSQGGERGLFYTIVRLARDFKNFMFVAATVFFFIITIKLLLSGNTEEELDHYKKGIIWITVGLIVMQIAYSFVFSIYDQGVSAGVAFRLLEYVINPMIRLLETLASVFFLGIAFYAFYRLVTSQGDEEKIEKAKKSIIQAIIGFLIIKFARLMVEATYGTINCTQIAGGLISIDNARCLKDADLSGFVGIIIRVINWANSFIAIVVVLLIIYAGAQIMLSGGDEEKIKKGKDTIKYIAVGLFVLVASFLILTFFLVPEATI